MSPCARCSKIIERSDLLEHTYAVIMAGGGGTRLWPLSNRARPKQMLRLGGERTLFQLALDRLEGLFPPQHILVVTVEEQARQLQAQCPQIPRENYLLEPLPRGTASVVGLATVALRQRAPQAIMAVLPADHFIENVPAFQKILVAATKTAEAGYLVTLGISPTYPATGYGYIQRGEELGMFDGHTAYRVLRFKEKPDQISAQAMLDGGDHDWNSGMFFWRIDRIWEAFEKLMPALTAKLIEIESAWLGEARWEVLQSVWGTIQPETIDYGVMEKAKGVAVLSGHDLGWNDVGSWDSLFDVLKADADGNIVIEADHLGMDTCHSLVVADRPERLIVTVGVEDLIVVDSGDALLVCAKGAAQRVRQVVEQLKQQGKDRYL